MRHTARVRHSRVSGSYALDCSVMLDSESQTFLLPLGETLAKFILAPTELLWSLLSSRYQLQPSGARSRRLETAGDGWRRLETGGDGGDGWGRGVLVRNSHVTVR